MNFRNLFLAISASLVAGSALAATSTSQMDVTATVVASCSVAATDLAFGDVDPFVGKAGQTTVSVTCSNGAAYDVGLDAGTTTGATTAARLLTSGTDTLAYNLYQDSGHQTVWGNTVDVDAVEGTGSGSAQVLNVYGNIPVDSTATIGTYSDVVTVTVTF